MADILPSFLDFVRSDEEGEADDGCVDERPTPDSPGSDY